MLESKRERRAPLSAESLARKYLSKAGYDPLALGEVAGLRRAANGSHEMEKCLKPVEIGAPVPAGQGSPTKDGAAQILAPVARSRGE